MAQKSWFGRLPPQTLAILLMSILVVLVVSQTPVSAIDPTPQDLHVGPYIDKLVYTIIPSQDQRVTALQAGEIELDTGFLDPSYLSTLDLDPDINLYSAMRNGYGQITINTRDYPLSISGLRRAFAFAFDKTDVTYGILDGFYQDHD